MELMKIMAGTVILFFSLILINRMDKKSNIDELSLKDNKKLPNNE